MGRSPPKARLQTTKPPTGQRKLPDGYQGTTTDTYISERITDEARNTHQRTAETIPIDAAETEADRIEVENPKSKMDFPQVPQRGIGREKTLREKKCISKGTEEPSV